MDDGINIIATWYVSREKRREEVIDEDRRELVEVDHEELVEGQNPVVGREWLTCNGQLFVKLKTYLVNLDYILVFSLVVLTAEGVDG